MTIQVLLAPLVLPLTQPLAIQDWWQPGVTALAAVVVIVGVVIVLVRQRRTSEETVQEVRRAADAAASSAAASDRSSKAAEEAVGVNRETAAGVARRAESDALAKRFQDAAQQIGHEKAAVRLAGAHMLARLADDWPDQRQSCIDVLCAYLRMPQHHESVSAAEGERQVRVAILTLIGHHLAGTPVSWSGCTFDLSYTELPWIEWESPVFGEAPNFTRARITGPVLIHEPRFERGATFAYTAFEGSVQISGARVTGGDLSLYGADLASGVLATDFLAEGSRIDLSRAVCRGDVGVSCSASPSGPQGLAVLDHLTVGPGGSLSLAGIDDHDAGPTAPRSVTSGAGAIISVEPEGSVRLPATFKQYSGAGIYNDVWKNS